jgi:hypothetical protein
MERESYQVGLVNGRSVSYLYVDAFNEMDAQKMAEAVLEATCQPLPESFTVTAEY